MMVGRSSLLRYESLNASLGWALVGALLLVAAGRALANEVLWAGLAVVVVLLAVVPPVRSGSPSEMIAWEALALAALPVFARTAGVLSETSVYLAVAALALVIAVELDAFSAVEMTSEFAVAFVVIVTMGTAALWTIAQFASDFYLGTSLLVDQTQVMWNLIAATGVGALAGGVFELYFRRVSRGHALAREAWSRGVDDSS